MPVTLIIYWEDPSMFVREVYIWTEDMKIDTSERWIQTFYDNNDGFATSVKEWNQEKGHLRHKEKVSVAKPGLPTLLGKLYQL